MRTRRASGVVLCGLGLACVLAAGADQALVRLAQVRLSGQATAGVAGGAAVPPTAVSPGLTEPAVPTGDVQPAPARAPAPAPPPAPDRAPVPAQGTPLFKLIIPRINVHNVVVYGTSEGALRKGPGLVEGTALPEQKGNTAIAGHRDYFFWRLGELQAGDEILIAGPHGQARYQVTAAFVVQDTQTEVLLPTPSPVVTLITCWPLIYPGYTPQRLVVRAAVSQPPGP